MGIMLFTVSLKGFISRTKEFFLSKLFPTWDSAVFQEPPTLSLAWDNDHHVCVMHIHRAE